MNEYMKMQIDVRLPGFILQVRETIHHQDFIKDNVTEKKHKFIILGWRIFKNHKVSLRNLVYLH